MCDECVGLQDQYRKTAERLTAAQRQLATYVLGRNESAFIHLWKECESALKELSLLRGEMATHAATHIAGSGGATKPG
jgi:hypothetical protein